MVQTVIFPSRNIRLNGLQAADDKLYFIILSIIILYTVILLVYIIT